MKKIFCDCCGKEIQQKNLNQISWKSHLTKMYIDHEFISCYVDSDFNPISGREDVYDLCNKCYNNIMGAAVKEFIKQKLKNK